MAFASLGAGRAAASGYWFDAPPPLDEYLQRLPAKAPGQILAETRPPKQVDAPKVRELVAAIGRRAKTEPAGKLLAEVDGLLARARAAHCSPGELSLIHDLHDLLVAAPQEAAGYIAWRCAHFEEINPAIKRVNYGEENEAPTAPAGLAEMLEANAQSASKPLRPHWLYLRAALEFNRGHKAAAMPFFSGIARQYPKHPRAELALLMLARCQISESRADQYSTSIAKDKECKRIGNEPAHQAARKTLEEYLKRYPKGRFLADVYGWMGALEWDQYNYAGALDRYIQQAETPDHPENLKSAAIMIEKAVRFLAQAPEGDAAFVAVARHPDAAMAMLYLLLGSSDGAGSLDISEESDKDQAASAVQLRQWRARLLPRFASAVAAQKETYSEALWQPRYAVILAHAASNAGKQEEALRILAKVNKPDSTDDLLLAKAIALQRMRDPKNAIPAFRALLERFPDSPLAPGVRIRLALALRDNHQAGLALVQLRKLTQKSAKKDAKAGDKSEESDPETSLEDSVQLLSPPDSELNGIDSVYYANYPNAESAQIIQEIDALLNFAPIPELAAALDDSELEPGFASDVRAVLASRSLAHEDFAAAKRFMTPAQYSLVAAGMEALTLKAAGATSPKEKAEIAMRLGDAWAAARGHFLGIPLDSVATKERVHPGAPYLAEARRKQNGKAMGFKDVDPELMAREELRHAARWWFDAARAVPGTPVSAAARLKVLEALAATARATPYAFERARIENMAETSRVIYQKLKEESPDSHELAEAAFWTVSGTATGNPHWDNRPAEDYRLHERGYRWSDFDAFNVEAPESGGEAIDAVGKLRALGGDLAKLKAAVDELRHGNEIASSPAAQNSLEDLALFLSEPSVSPEIARSYVSLRIDTLACAYTGESRSSLQVQGVSENSDIDEIVRKRIATAVADPKMQQVRDYLDFLDAAIVANHRVSISTTEQSKGEPFTYISRDYPELEKMMRTFLERYPKSKKREAARLLLARAVFRLSWPSYGYMVWPKGAPVSVIDVGPKRFEQEALDSRKVMAELDGYDRDYPKGRYADDVRAMRAAVLWRDGSDWGGALQITLDLLERGSAELKADASIRLANLFAELATPARRPVLLAAIRKNPKAIERLKQYLDRTPGNLDHPLLFLGDYLGSELGFKFAPAPKRNSEG